MQNLLFSVHTVIKSLNLEISLPFGRLHQRNVPI